MSVPSVMSGSMNGITTTTEANTSRKTSVIIITVINQCEVKTMIVRKLVRVYSDEYGYDGWLPVNRKDDPYASPANGFTVAHDILEHEVDKIGGAEGEFMALGALCWIRGESSWFLGKSYIPFTQMLSGDIADILSKVAHE